MLAPPIDLLARETLMSDAEVQRMAWLEEDNARLQHETAAKDHEIAALRKAVLDLQRAQRSHGASSIISAPLARLSQVNFPSRCFPHEIETAPVGGAPEEERWAIVRTIYAVIEIRLTDPSGTRPIAGTELKEGGIPLRMSLLRADTLEEVKPEENKTDGKIFLFAEGAENVTMVGSHLRYRFRLLMLSSWANRNQFRIMIKPTDPALTMHEELVMMTRPFTSHARRDANRSGVNSAAALGHELPKPKAPPVQKPAPGLPPPSACAVTEQSAATLLMFASSDEPECSNKRKRTEAPESMVAPDSPRAIEMVPRIRDAGVVNLDTDDLASDATLDLASAEKPWTPEM